MTSQKGLQEIRTPEALEALISSLNPTTEKEKLTVEFSEERTRSTNFQMIQMLLNSK